MVYTIVDPHSYVLMTIDGKLMGGLFEHERLKPAVLRTDEGNANTLFGIKESNEFRSICLTHSSMSQGG